MQYCENCHVSTNEERCPFCGGKKLRSVQQDDFCFVTETDSMSGEILTGVFDENEIKYSALPYGSGVESWFGLPLKNYRIFVPYSQLEKAQGIITQRETAQTDEWKEYILKNAEQLNITQRLEKKYKKKLKLSKEQDFFEYCINLIKNAQKILDKGLAAIEHKEEVGGHYLYCYKDNVTICLNSKSFKIYSILIS